MKASVFVSAMKKEGGDRELCAMAETYPLFCFKAAVIKAVLNIDAPRLNNKENRHNAQLK